MLGNPMYTEIPFVAVNQYGEKTTTYPTGYGRRWQAETLSEAAEVAGKAVELADRIYRVLRRNRQLRVEVGPVTNFWGWQKGDEDPWTREHHTDSKFNAGVFVSCDAHPELDEFLGRVGEGEVLPIEEKAG